MVDTKIVEDASCLKWRGGSTQHGRYCKTSSLPRRRESSDSIQMPLEKSMGAASIGGFDLTSSDRPCFWGFINRASAKQVV